MKKFFTIMLMVLAITMVVNAEETKKVDLTPQFWAYFQPQGEWTKVAESFSISQGRGFVFGNLSNKISYLIEVQSVPAPVLLKAQFAWMFAKDNKIILGQQSNSFKFFLPDPSVRNLVAYPLMGLIPSTEDIGITLDGKLPMLEYRFSVFNGAGTNRKDDNKEKDVVGWVKFSPTNWFSLTGCYQGGHQGTGTSGKDRSGEWVQLELKPFSWLSVKPTWVKRNDFEKDSQGWLVVSQAQINSTYQLLVQYLNDCNSDKELTLGGIICLSSRFRILPNVFYRFRTTGSNNFGVYIMAHINVGKDI
jgi:hypothetical protein